MINRIRQMMVYNMISMRLKSVSDMIFDVRDRDNTTRVGERITGDGTRGNQ